MKKRLLYKLFVGFLLVFLSLANAGQDSTKQRKNIWTLIYENFEFMPEYHMESDLLAFFFQGDRPYFKERYFLETNLDIEFALVSFREFAFWVWSFEFLTGMGRQSDDVLFDPVDITYGIVPTFEFRLPKVNAQIGVNHHCFHEIDRHDYPTVYWNKLFAGVGSKNMRVYDYWAALKETAGWTMENRIAWYASGGWYVRKFFGILRESTINGINRNLLEISGRGRYAFYRRKSWIVNAFGEATLGYYKELAGQPKERGAYWRIDLGLENNFRRGKRGCMFFAILTFDDLPKYQGLPRFSKQGLLQLGVRFFI